jgi:hypothetical protein
MTEYGFGISPDSSSKKMESVHNIPPEPHISGMIAYPRHGMLLHQNHTSTSKNPGILNYPNF